ncbi:MAG: GNAT family N-acetyltransferase [Chitinophagaceae bacterium]|nr:GNAT family N-acetyltransferase [Chitinophagaceae bacterium]
MYNFEIIESDNVLWDTIVKSAYLYDFHHTSYYHNIDNNYRSVLFYASDGENFIALPLVVRPIEDTPWFDCTSVYGYCGPVFNKPIEELPDDLFIFFSKQFNAYCRENDIISVFSRLHPIIHQKKIFQDFGNIRDMNKTVSIDLTLSPEEQRKHYRDSSKYEINQLKRKGFIITAAENDEEIDSFIDIYYNTMNRVNASKYYYFDRNYFHSFLKNNFFGKTLLLAKFEGEIAAGAIFTYTDKIMQYHLAGSNEKYIKQTPMKLIIDEARLLGNRLGLQYLHLGGGVGGRDDDSLFKFKAGFSDLYYQFSVWRYITDNEKYGDLVLKKNNLVTTNDFFPLYRL